ncbi:fluoride efflux transporter FluC [Candidatus Synechococcus spongiarum]|nr:CrcB family protein [Candidatus Synechococcus spongiarum]
MGHTVTDEARRFLLVTAGAIPGALLRWEAAVQLGPCLPPGGSDLLVNGVGSLLLGWLVTRPFRQDLQLLLGAGFCGSLSTFSSWMLVTVRLQQQGFVMGLLWLALGLAVGLAMAWLGQRLGQGRRPS